MGAAVSVLVSATAFTVWNQSNVNEKVYTVSMFTIAALSWLAFLWRDYVEEHRGVRGSSRFHDDNVLVLMVFMLALSVGNHLMAFLATPGSPAWHALTLLGSTFASHPDGVSARPAPPR